MPGFLSSNLYYKYLNDLIHSVRGDEFLGGGVLLTALGSAGPTEDSHPGSADSSAVQVVTPVPLRQDCFAQILASDPVCSF